MPGPPPTVDFATLLRLLDDDTPEVRRSVADALAGFDGDVSDLLGGAGIEPGASGRTLLSELLRPSRRERLRREWVVPVDGIAPLHDDWDHCESLMRAVSDFLHDGVTLRQPLADALDLLAEETEEAWLAGGPAGFLAELFRRELLVPDPRGELDPTHLDLAAVAGGHPSNAVGCGLVALLVARRLGAGLSAINLPGAFVLVCDDERGGTLHDPGAGGRRIDREDFLHRIRRYPRDVRMRCDRPATAGELLLRLLEELATGFAVTGRDDDAALIEELLASLGG